MTKATNKDIKIPFSKLALDPMNVRKTYDPKGILELAQNIAVQGVLQNLVVRPATKRGHYLVTAGGRRFRAVEHLIKEGTFVEDHELSCLVKSEQDATEISLSENIMREAMHPADQFRAFKTLADEGKTTEEIARQFGTTDTIVAKRLKLARVSPALFALYENGDMELAQLQAFTVSDDHEAQERVWERLPQYYRNGRDIRNALTDGKIPATDKRVKFIGGLEAMRQAGGTVICDLFSEQDGGYVEDVALLEKLVAEKVDALSLEIASEGWKWVRYQADIDYSEMNTFGRHYPEATEYSDDDREKLHKLEEDYDAAVERYEETDDDEDRKAFEAANEAIDALADKYQPTFTEAQKAEAGVLLSISYQGELRVERGLIDPQDIKKQSSACATDSETIAETPRYTKALTAELTARKTAALRLELAKNPAIALAVTVHTMAIKTLYDHKAAWDNGTLQISVDNACLDAQIKDAGQCGDLDLFERQREAWKSVIPVNPADLWDWCLSLKQQELLELQAFLIAQSINAVDQGDGYNQKAVEHGDRIGTALGTNMADHFEPTAENFFSRMNLNAIHECLVEACGEETAAPALKMKKKEAASYAADKIKGTGWLPDLMHFAGEAPALDEGTKEAA